MSFFLSIDPDSAKSLAFIFKGQNLLVKIAGKKVQIPTGAEVRGLKIRYSRPLYIGNKEDTPCFCAQAEPGAEPDSSTGFHGLRGLFGNIDERLYKMASLALQVNNWDQISGYCGSCGAPHDLAHGESAKQCGACGRIEYPRISPAVIMSVVRKDQILLARSRRIKNSFFSVLAGYVEVGENLEECVKREVYEEVGLSVKNIRYFASQSWPFSNALMIAFTAEHESGQIRIDNQEIREAGWFSANNLPALPGWGSVSRRLVDAFVARNA